MIGELYTPPMYRDLMSSGMPMFEFDPSVLGMGSMYGGLGMAPFYNTNYLGGVTLKPNLKQDTVNLLKSREKSAENSLLNFGKVALGVIGLGILAGFLKGKKLPWYTRAKNSITDGFSRIKNHAPSGTAGTKKWYNPISWFKKAPTP